MVIEAVGAMRRKHMDRDCTSMRHIFSILGANKHSNMFRRDRLSSAARVLCTNYCHEV
jgi:hypothetical protein